MNVPQRKTIWICLSLTALVWIVFAQTLGHGFINFDDGRYVYQNENVLRGLTWANLGWVWTHAHASLWHPLTTLSHMMDCTIFGLRPAGHHFTNVLLHGIGAVLIFLVLNQMTGSIWRSAFVAAVFAIHPMRVESVAWVSERKDVLSGVFFALTLGAYVRYARRPAISSYLLVLLLYGCGVLSKATLVTVPVLLPLLDYWPLRRVANLAQALRFLPEKVPLLALAAVSSIMTVHAQQETMASLAQLALLPRIKNAVVSLVVYLRQMFWPAGLAIFYPHPHDQLQTWVVIACAIIVAAVTAIAIILRRQYPYLFVGWFWFLIMVLPVLGITQAGLQAHADRFTYLPHIGLTIMLSWGAYDLSRSWRHRETVMGALAGTAVVLMAVIAWRQTTYWQDSISIWTRTLAVTKDDQIAQQNLAAALWEKGDKHDFAIHSRAAGIVHWETILKDYPNQTGARDQLGTLLYQSGRVQEAIEQWRTSLQFDASDGNALDDLAWALATCPDAAIRNGRAAVDYAERAAALPGGESPLVLRTLAAARAENGEFDAAADTARRASDLAQTQQNTSLVETLEREISLYRSAEPYREAPPSD